MDTTVVMSVMRDAVGVTLKLGGPMLLLSMLVGVVVAVLQAVTQIHEQTISFALKLIVVVLVLLVKQGLMVFDYVKSMTAGGPGTATQTIALLIYNNGFERNRYSYSIAQAIATGVIIALISAIQIQASNRKKVD